MTIPFKTENKHDRAVNFENAKVAIPIVSMHEWNCMGHRTTLDADWGVTHHLANNEDDPVLIRSGVYFLKMYVDKSLLDKQKGFGRLGAR